MVYIVMKLKELLELREGYDCNKVTKTQKKYNLSNEDVKRIFREKRYEFIKGEQNE